MRGAGRLDLLQSTNHVRFVDAKTEELRATHNDLAEIYADRLADGLDHMPADRAVLDLFCELALAAGLGTSVADIGCGTGRLAPYLAAKGLTPGGVDLAPEMVARRDHPDFDFSVADLHELPIEDASLAGVVRWSSLFGASAGPSRSAGPPSQYPTMPNRPANRSRSAPNRL